MKMVTKIRASFFIATGSCILPNGCISYTFNKKEGKPSQIVHQFSERADDIVKAIRSNDDETGGCIDRTRYIEMINAWLQLIKRDDLQMPLTYNITTINRQTVNNQCLCGNEWNAVDYEGQLLRPEIPNHVIEYNNSTIHKRHNKCRSCEMMWKITHLCNLVNGLVNECQQRQMAAVRFFEFETARNPADYKVEHHTTRFNYRDGAILGYTCKGRATDVCYIVKKSKRSKTP